MDCAYISGHSGEPFTRICRELFTNVVSTSITGFRLHRPANAIKSFTLDIELHVRGEFSDEKLKDSFTLSSDFEREDENDGR